MDALNQAIEKAGGQAKLAALLGLTPMAVSQWKKRGVPPERAVEIEAATGGAVTRADLRPDLFGDAAQQQAA